MMVKHMLTTKDHGKTRKFELSEEDFERFLMYFEENELLSQGEYESLMHGLSETSLIKVTLT